MKADTPTFWSLIIWQIFTNCIYHITMSSKYLHQLWTYFLCIFKSVTHYFFICDNSILCLLVINLLAETNSSCRLYFYLQQLCFVFTGDKLSITYCNQFFEESYVNYIKNKLVAQDFMNITKFFHFNDICFLVFFLFIEVLYM